MFPDLNDHVYHLRPPRQFTSDVSCTDVMTTSTSTSGTVAPSDPAVSNPSFTSSSAFTFTSSTPDGVGFRTVTTTIPVTTITQQSTTFTSFTQSISTQTYSYPQSMSTSASAAFATASVGTVSLSTCAGQGIDAPAAGLLVSIILPSAIGLILWLIFAIVRPRFRQIYALREWFVPQNLRPRPLGSGFFAFLFPHVPLVPSVPEDVSNAGRNPAQDAELFPSDEQLSQRTLWVALLIALAWSVLALAGALPLYLVNTPCNSDFPPSVYGGGYSTLTDLSLIRLLRIIDSGQVSSSDLTTLMRRGLDSTSDPYHLHIRIIVLTILTILLGTLPVLRKILREFGRIAAFRNRWLEVRCEGKDMAWLSARKAPAYATWGERQFKDFLVKIRLSSTFAEQARRNHNDGGARARNGQRVVRRREEEEPLTARDNEDRPEIDIESLFSIGITHHLALLIHERDEILENLEIAETKYISSFRVTTPDPSILDFVPTVPPMDPRRPYISRPLPLAAQGRRTRSRRHLNHAYGSSSFAPTSFVAPSSYYKLRGVQGINGGRFADLGPKADRHQSLSESISSRVVGSRFMEVNRNSAAYGQLPLGSHVAVEKDGELGPVSDDYWMSSIPDPRLHGPNYGLSNYEGLPVDEHGVVQTIPEQDEWIDVSTDNPDEMPSDLNSNFQDQAGPSSFIRRSRRLPKGDSTTESTKRESFPRRMERVDPDDVLAPHLRLQPMQPFVRPLDGLGFEDLGVVYAEITHWRSRLKAINFEIADRQRECYNDIATGNGITGWLMVGRGLRFIPGAEIIEGRAKEDIRWDVLQNERSWLDKAVMWSVILVVSVGLAFVLIPAIGLSLATAPDVAHYLPFLRPIVSAHPILAGLATIFAPAVAATIFVIVGLSLIHWIATIHGSISVSGNQIFVFKITFFVLTFVVTIWLIAIGAILFSMQALSTNSGSAGSIGSGSVYMAVLCLAVIFNIAIIVPACLLLQPFRLWRVINAEKQAITPRQRFRAVYPRTYNPSFAIGACVLAILFASTFTLIFPLMAPAVVVILLLSLVAHRFLVGYVYARTHSQTGGLLQLWLLKRFGTLLSLQPILLGLIVLSRHFWIEGGILIGSGILVIIIVEIYTNAKTRLPDRNSLNAAAQESLRRFETGINRPDHDDNDTLQDIGSLIGRPRGSMASVLEMMSLTLAVMPSSSKNSGPIPLPTESLDDLTATERAARTHPDAPPHLPPLPFADHAEEMAGILYAPELVAPPPIIWLPNDSAGVARSEAIDLQKYHDLQVTLDVRSKDDVPRRSSDSRRRNQTASS